MSRVIAIGPGGKAQAPVRDDRCRPVIEYVRETGQLDQLLLSPRLRTMADAAELRLAMYRSARYYCSCGHPYCTRKYKNYPPDNGCPHGGQRISVRADVVKITETEADEKTGQPVTRVWYAVQFKLMDKREAMRAVVQKYGPDPNNWPYFAKRKQLKEK